jgi:hypothetical protein
MFKHRVAECIHNSNTNESITQLEVLCSILHSSTFSSFSSHLPKFPLQPQFQLFACLNIINSKLPLLIEWLPQASSQRPLKVLLEITLRLTFRRSPFQTLQWKTRTRRFPPIALKRLRFRLSMQNLLYLFQRTNSQLAQIAMARGNQLHLMLYL